MSANFLLIYHTHGRQQRGAVPPPGFSYMIDTVDRGNSAGLFLLFFGLIFCCPPTESGLIVLFFVFFLLFFGLFFSLALTLEIFLPTPLTIRSQFHKTIFQHKYLHALAKLATAEGIELPSLSGKVRNLTAELSASAFA